MGCAGSPLGRGRTAVPVGQACASSLCRTDLRQRQSSGPPPVAQSSLTWRFAAPTFRANHVGQGVRPSDGCVGSTSMRGCRAKVRGRGGGGRMRLHVEMAGATTHRPARSRRQAPRGHRGGAVHVGRLGGAGGWRSGRAVTVRSAPRPTSPNPFHVSGPHAVAEPQAPSRRHGRCDHPSASAFT